MYLTGTTNPDDMAIGDHDAYRCDRTNGVRERKIGRGDR